MCQPITTPDPSFHVTVSLTPPTIFGLAIICAWFRLRFGMRDTSSKPSPRIATQRANAKCVTMDGETLEDGEPIFGLATECEKLFDDRIERLKVDDHPDSTIMLAELRQRFANWAAFLGVFTESKVCLDRKLRHHVEIRDQVLRLLDIMEQNLTYREVYSRTPHFSSTLTISSVFKPDKSPNRMDIEPAVAPPYHAVSIESLRAISGAVDRVIHLGIAIRQFSAKSRANKARAYQEKFDLSSFEEVAYLALKTLYADASEELIEQLTRSMTDTYTLYISRKSRQKTLQAPREQPRLHAPLSVIAEEPGQADSTLAGGPVNIEMSAAPQESKTSTALSSPRRPPPVRQHHLHPPSETLSSINTQEYNQIRSPRAKSILSSHVNYPRPSNGSLKCQWCFGPLPEEPKWTYVSHNNHIPPFLQR